MPTLTYNQWVAIGIEQGWCGPIVCYTHDGVPLTVDEEDDIDNDEAELPCVHIIRLYEDNEMRLGVEYNHSPSNWRKPPDMR